jgi:outer membrane immunogenic protein
MKKILYIIMLGCLSISAKAYAAVPGQGYLGAGLHFGNYDEAGYSSVSPGGATVRGGFYLSNFIAIEGRYGFGLFSDKLTFYDPGYGYYDVKIKLKDMASAFVKFDLPLSRYANLYGLLGFSQGKIEGSSGSITESLTDNSYSYGFGGEFAISNDLYFGGEYVMYLDERSNDYYGFYSGYYYSGINIGVTKYF